MKDFTNVALLQPITDATPLAGLLNRLLLALAPAAALIDPTRPSAARDCLQDATTGAHFLHSLVARMVCRLEAGKGLKSYWVHIQGAQPRRTLYRPFRRPHEVLALASTGPGLLTPQEVYKTVRYSWAYLDKLNAKPCAFEADRKLLLDLVECCWEASREVDTYFEQSGETEQLAGQCGLALLRCVLAADVSGLPAARHYIEDARGAAFLQFINAQEARTGVE